MAILQLLDFRARRYARQRQSIEDLLSKGTPDRARALLDRYEKRWRINWENGSRASILRDYEHLRWLLRRRSQLGGVERAAALKHALAAVDRLIAFVQNPDNYRGDGRCVRNSAVFVRLNDQLAQARRGIRASAGSPAPN